jgi:glycosyltransferase involved in cell wall biosynthesis
MNSAAFNALATVASINYVGPIDPKESVRSRTTRRILKLVGVPPCFSSFSVQRLNRIKESLTNLVLKNADLDFFHGFTPWIAYEPANPYIAWSDCTFSQYISIFHRGSVFNKKDIIRIIEMEKKWLQRATAIWFRSNWAAEGAIAEYDLQRTKVHCVGNYGFMPTPQFDAYKGGMNCIFIAKNFLQKGGELAVKVVEKLREDFAAIKLLIVGEKPSNSILSQPFVEYLGDINKTVDGDVERLAAAIATARVLIHPTMADTNPMVLLEAGYFGCPSVASDLAAIPEIVIDGKTGFVIPENSFEDFLRKMKIIYGDEERYQKMRSAVWQHTHTRYSSDVFNEKVASLLSQHL